MGRRVQTSVVGCSRQSSAVGCARQSRAEWLGGAAELLGVPLTITPLSELHQPDANGRGGIGQKGMEPKAKA